MVAVDHLEEVVDAREFAIHVSGVLTLFGCRSVPKQMLLLLGEFRIWCMDREFELLAVVDECCAPFTHFFSAPAGNSFVVDGERCIGHHEAFIYAEHASESFACGTCSYRIVEVEHHLGRLIETHAVGLEYL